MMMGVNLGQNVWDKATRDGWVKSILTFAIGAAKVPRYLILAITRLHTFEDGG